MKLTTFWHILFGLNLGLGVFSWAIQDMSLLGLNLVAAAACIIAAWAASSREELEKNTGEQVRIPTIEQVIQSLWILTIVVNFLSIASFSYYSDLNLIRRFLMVNFSVCIVLSLVGYVLSKRQQQHSLRISFALGIYRDMSLDFNDTLRVGDLVRHPSVLKGEPDTIGIVIKKRFKPQDVQGQQYTILTYEVLFSDGEIQSLKQNHLRVIQSVTQTLFLEQVLKIHIYKRVQE